MEGSTLAHRAPGRAGSTLHHRPLLGRGFPIPQYPKFEIKVVPAISRLCKRSVQLMDQLGQESLTLHHSCQPQTKPSQPQTWLQDTCPPPPSCNTAFHQDQLYQSRSCQWEDRECPEPGSSKAIQTRCCNHIHVLVQSPAEHQDTRCPGGQPAPHHTSHPMGGQGETSVSRQSPPRSQARPQPILEEA